MKLLITRKGEFMKKFIAILMVLVLVVSCSTAFAAQDSSTTKTTSASTQKPGFFRDMAALFQKQIPETEKSQTYDRLWDPSSEQKSK